MTFRLPALLAIPLCLAAAPLAASTHAAFHAEGVVSTRLVSVVSLTDGSDRSGQVSNGCRDRCYDGIWRLSEDAKSHWVAGAPGFDHYRGVGVTGTDSRADGTAVTALYGEELLLGYNYRPDCTNTWTPDASCVGDVVRMTFDYHYEATLSATVADAYGAHDAIGKVRIDLGMALEDRGTPIDTWRLSPERAFEIQPNGTEQHSARTWTYSGQVEFDVPAGFSVNQRLAVVAEGSGNLAPSPVPLPASMLFLLAGVAGLLTMSRRRPA